LGNSAISAVSAFKRWGLKTLGELAVLPPADLVSRMGRPALAWQAMARGEDLRPLVPMLEDERFESSLDLEWPIEGLEPLSFVLTRLLEPLSTRLERRDRGAAVLHVILRLVVPGPEPGEIHARRLELPTPLRDVRTLRTLALLDLESHPPAAAIDRVTVVIDPTPGRVLQHTLFTRAHPTPEQLSTLLARLGAVMGQDRIGAPATVDSYRPGAFAMTPFAIEHHDQRRARGTRSENPLGGEIDEEDSAVSASSALNVVSALRRCRQPVPARVAVSDGRPVRVTTDRREFAGGAVLHCAGPWRTSGEWWADTQEGSSEKLEVKSENFKLQTFHFSLPSSEWDRDEWDVALGDGAVYRIFQERARGAWFIDAIVD
jgi:protein ImuB